jgi:hypothetical protein
VAGAVKSPTPQGSFGPAEPTRIFLAKHWKISCGSMLKIFSELTTYMSLFMTVGEIKISIRSYLDGHISKDDLRELLPVDPGGDQPAELLH